MSRYLIMIEATSTGFSTYSPDLPGCVATGRTREEVEREMREAIEFHLEGLRLAGEPVPEPGTEASCYEIVDTNAGNIDRCGFCGYKDANNLGHRRKAEWLKARYAEGLRFKVLRSERK